MAVAEATEFAMFSHVASMSPMCPFEHSPLRDKPDARIGMCALFYAVVYAVFKRYPAL